MEKEREQNRGRGRPTKYDEKYNDQAYKLCLLGADDSELADFFEVTETTINNWKLEYEDFFESVKRGKHDSDYQIVDSLRKRAKGMCIKKDIVVNGEVLTLENEIPPDPTSMIFWLKNRQPKKWRDKQDVEHSGEVKNTGTMRLLTREEMSQEEKDDIGYID